MQRKYYIMRRRPFQAMSDSIVKGRYMQRILEELYMGNIGFDSGHYGPDSPFVKAARRKLDSMEKLNAMLDGTGKKLFDAYCEA
jgi:hypothetical protein